MGWEWGLLIHTASNSQEAKLTLSFRASCLHFLGAKTTSLSAVTLSLSNCGDQTQGFLHVI